MRKELKEEKLARKEYESLKEDEITHINKQKSHREQEQY